MANTRVVVLLVCCFSGALGLRAYMDYPSIQESVTPDCKLRKEVRVNMTVNGKTTSLFLSKLGLRPQVYLPRATGFVKYDSPKRENVAEYRSQYPHAEFKVECRLVNKNMVSLILDGEIVLDRKIYTVKKDPKINVYILEEARLDVNSPAIDGLQSLGEAESGGRFIRSVGERLKRQISEDVHVDVIALIEKSVYDIWFARATGSTTAARKTDAINNIELNFVHMFNSVDLKYKTVSDKIFINLIGIIIEDQQSGTWFTDVWNLETDPSIVDSSALLTSMEAYRTTAGFPEHDHLCSFTDINLHRNGNTVVAGLASVAQVCKDGGKSVSTCEYQDNIEGDARIAAHEIAHCLSAAHDGDGNACNAGDNYIMSASPAFAVDTNPFQFSSCSADYFNAHINGLLSGSATEQACLREQLTPIGLPDVGDDLPGSVSLDAQCQREFGEDASYCRSIDSGYDVCLRLPCRKPGATGCTYVNGDPGRSCGDRKWCINGECVYALDAPPIDPICPYGDEPGPQPALGGATCAEFFTNKLNCNNDNAWKFCCETCSQFVRTGCSKTCTFPERLHIDSCKCIIPPGCTMLTAFGGCSDRISGTYWYDLCCI